MSPRNSFSSTDSTGRQGFNSPPGEEGESSSVPGPAVPPSRSPQSERNSNNMTPQAGFSSPDRILPSSNHLRRSLVLRLDRERREHCETADEANRPLMEPSVSEDVFLPRDGDLLDALDLDGSRHRPLQLRLRPVASHDMDEFCATCGGSTVLFQTPRQRRSSIPRQDQREPLPLPCRCHDSFAATTQGREPHSAYGPRLSFVHLASPAENGQLLLAASDRNENAQESLELSLFDDDSTDGEDINRNQDSAFRRANIVLQPKAINRCHSDPVYDSRFLNADRAAQGRSIGDEPTSCHSAPHPPGLLHLSSNSSTTTSPGDLQQISHSLRAPTTVTQDPVENTAFSSVSPRHDHASPKNSSTVPPIPTMETPEMNRPLMRSIALAPKAAASTRREQGSMLLDNEGLSVAPPFPLAPMLEGSMFDDDSNHNNNEES